MNTESTSQTLSWWALSCWHWLSARLARRCRTALRLAGEAVLIVAGTLGAIAGAAILLVGSLIRGRDEDV